MGLDSSRPWTAGIVARFLQIGSNDDEARCRNVGVTGSTGQRMLPYDLAFPQAWPLACRMHECRGSGAGLAPRLDGRSGMCGHPCQWTCCGRTSPHPPAPPPGYPPAAQSTCRGCTADLLTPTYTIFGPSPPYSANLLPDVVRERTSRPPSPWPQRDCRALSKARMAAHTNAIPTPCQRMSAHASDHQLIAGKGSITHASALAMCVHPVIAPAIT